MASGILAKQNNRSSAYRSICVRVVVAVLDVIFVGPLFLMAFLGRLIPKSRDIGIGPVPIVCSQYYKKALVSAGYTVETFTDSIWHHTDDFDLRGDRLFPGVLRGARPYALMAWVLLRYRVLYIYFDGGPLRVTTWLWRFEPLMLHLAGVRIVATAFGADIHVLTRTTNRLFVHQMGRDYPAHRLYRRRVSAKVDLWTRFADHIVAGVDWIEYLYYWDSLVLAPFPIDTDRWSPDHRRTPETRPVRVVHASNHRGVKGTDAIIDAVGQLETEGVEIELEVLENVSNKEIHDAMCGADVIVDQLIIGWYAMFTLEAMALGKPVICHIRRDFVEMYEAAGVIKKEELPLIDATPATIKEVLRDLVRDRDRLTEIGQRSRSFVETHHSIATASRRFDTINRALGVTPASK